jgi:hypothetical protein
LSDPNSDSNTRCGKPRPDLAGGWGFFFYAGLGRDRGGQHEPVCGWDIYLIVAIVILGLAVVVAILMLP